MRAAILLVPLVACATQPDHDGPGGKADDDDVATDGWLDNYVNPWGVSTTFIPDSVPHRGGPFFDHGGPTGRTCATCHHPADGWSLRADSARAAFDASQGTAPLFQTFDAAITATADVSTVDARRAAYKLLLERGLFRVEMTVPATAEFVVESVEDPYGYATPERVVVYRRPLPTTNLRFNLDVMWDGRDTKSGGLESSLRNQAANALDGHGKVSLTDELVAQVVTLELALHTTQTADNRAGKLTEASNAVGPLALRRAPFREGQNDPFATNFDREAFKLFGAWANAGAERARIARGEKLFNTKMMVVNAGDGLNDSLGRVSVNVTCSSCHNAASVGSHTRRTFIDIGVASDVLRRPDVPLYTLLNKTTGRRKQTTDPGRALVTGKWQDIGRFKVPTLRALAARAPYFHDGSAATIEEVVELYDKRFDMYMNAEDKADLAAFLRSL